MSKFCIGIIRNNLKNTASVTQREITESIMNYAERMGFELTYGYIYEEPFLAHTLVSGDVVFELTKDRCAETILCPDWCRHNDEFLTPFVDRMRNLQALVQYIKHYKLSVDLFIGESGCEWEEFVHHTVRSSDLITYLEYVYRQQHDIPDVHISIAY